MAPVTIQTLTLELDGTSYECQLTGARLEPTHNDNEVITFCGTFTTKTTSWALILAGFQDWGDAQSINDMLWDADDAGADVQFTLVVGDQEFTGAAAGRKTVVGGDAGDPLDFEVTLPVQGEPTKAPVTPPGTASGSKTKTKAKAA